jgi:ankyrin repeat protein
MFNLSGRFRWVFCQLETLRHCLPPSIRRALNELPESLDETYERILKEIKKPNRDHAYRLLQCLVVAIRPLRVDELAEVLAVDFDDEEGIPKLKSSWRWDDHEQALFSSCSSLIAIVDSHGSKVVQFSHFSVKEFLVSPRLLASTQGVSHYHIVVEAAHGILAQACLAILLRSEDQVEHNGVENSSPLARYAAEHWVTHAQFEHGSFRIQKAMECLFDFDKLYFRHWIELYDIDTRYGRSSALSQFLPFTKTDATPLYYAAQCGFEDLVRHLIARYPQHVSATGGYCMTPAVAALAGKHFEVARLLHQNGSSVDPRGHFLWSPLHSAAHVGDLEMVRILVELNADVNAASKTLQTPLHCASLKGYSEVVLFLLEHGADASVRTKEGLTPLHRASERGRSEVVYLLIEHGVDTDAKDDGGMTSLHWASEYGWSQVVRVLIEHGADVIAKDNNGKTPLRVALDRKEDEIVELLTKYGASEGT